MTIKPLYYKLFLNNTNINSTIQIDMNQLGIFFLAVGKFWPKKQEGPWLLYNFRHLSEKN